MFENIECEWPLFLCYLVLDSQFQGDKALVEEYSGELEKVGRERGALVEEYSGELEKVEGEQCFEPLGRRWP